MTRLGGTKDMNIERKHLIKILGLEPQRCFPCSDGSMCCNYVIRGLKPIRPKNGDWLHFWPKFKWKKTVKRKKEIPALTGISNERKEAK